VPTHNGCGAPDVRRLSIQLPDDGCPTQCRCCRSERLRHAETFIGNLGIKTVFEGDEATTGHRPTRW
jgi:hypothetical protein